MDRKQAESIKLVWNSFEALRHSLKEICSNSNSFDRNTRTKSLCLNIKLHSFEFNVSLIFMKIIMYKLKSLTETGKKMIYN